jgi:predicted DNA-binding transcriptional regulator YafY
MPVDALRNRPLRRVLRLALRLQTLRTRPTLDALASEFRVSPRTVRRDLYALADAGWPAPALWTAPAIQSRKRR